MIKPHRRWFLVSLAHPLFSVIGIVLGHTISGGPCGWLGYAAALSAFLVNLPGVLLIKPFYHSTPTELASTTCLVYFAMIAITWLLVVVPTCYLVSRYLSNRAVR